jgi:hypothetical protein
MGTTAAQHAEQAGAARLPAVGMAGRKSIPLFPRAEAGEEAGASARPVRMRPEGERPAVSPPTRILCLRCCTPGAVKPRRTGHKGEELPPAESAGRAGVVATHNGYRVTVERDSDSG